MSHIDLFADNDFGGKIYLEVIDTVTGLPTPLVAGVVSGFLALLKTDAAALVFAAPYAAISLSFNLTYVGAQAGNVVGEWEYFVDATKLPRAALDALKTSKLWLIIIRPNSRWLAVQIRYQGVQEATIAA